MLLLITTMICVAVAGGSYVASLHFKGEPPPPAVALIHGVIGVIATLLLAGLAIAGRNDALFSAVGVFTIAAVGGFYLFSFRRTVSDPPRSAITIHALIALAGLALFVYIAFVG